MLDEALKSLIGQGVVGAMLVLLILAVVYLQKRRDSDGEARLKDTRENLISAAETNRVLGVMNTAVSGLNQSMASLCSTVQLLHSDTKSAMDHNRQRDDRVERMIETNGELIRSIENVVKENSRLIERANARLDQIKS